MVTWVTKLQRNHIEDQQQKISKKPKNRVFCNFFSSDQSNITHFTSYSMHLPLLALLSLLGRKSHATTSYLVECIQICTYIKASSASIQSAFTNIRRLPSLPFYLELQPAAICLPNQDRILRRRRQCRCLRAGLQFVRAQSFHGTKRVERVVKAPPLLAINSNQS